MKYNITPSMLESLTVSYFSCFGKIISLPEYNSLTKDANEQRIAAADLAVDILEVLEIYVDEFRKALLYQDQRFPYKRNTMPKVHYLPLSPADKTRIEQMLEKRSTFAGKMNTILNCIGYMASDKEGKWKLYYMGYNNALLMSQLEH